MLLFLGHNFLFALIITHNGGNPDGRLRCSLSHFLVVSKLLVKCGQDGIWDFGIRVLFNPDSLRTQKADECVQSNIELSHQFIDSYFCHKCWIFVYALILVFGAKVRLFSAASLHIKIVRKSTLNLFAYPIAVRFRL